MRKLIAWLLLLTLCLGLFAGCKKQKPQETDPTTAPTTPVTTDPTEPNNGGAVKSELEAALEYIKTVYRKPSEKTPKDFQRIGNVPVNGKNYEVVWTVNVGEDIIKIVKGDNGMVTIDVKEDVEAEVKYVLTATISDDKGNKVSYSWNHLIPVAGNMVDIVNDAYALEPGASMDYEVTLTGKVVSIDTPWDAGYKNITVTIVVAGAEGKPIQCYRLGGDGADKLKPNDTITVTGKLKNYNGTIEFDAGCTLDKLVAGEEVKAPSDPKQILKDAYALAEGGALPYKSTLTGVVTKINTEYSMQYKNLTVTIVVGGDTAKAIQCYRLSGDKADQIGVGDTITVTGWIVNYKGTVQFNQGCTLDKFQDTGKNEPKPEDTFTTTLVPEIVTAPQAGVAYKFFMFQKSYEKNFYLTGEMDGFYYQTTYDPAKAVDVFVEEVSGGYRLYFMKGNVKNYLEIVRAMGTDNKMHNNVVFTTTPTAVAKWNATIKSFTFELDVDGTKTDYYFGTYEFYKTFSASDVARITGENAGKMDTENFVGRLATLKETKVSEAEKAYEQLKTDYPPADGALSTTEDFTRKNVYDVDGKKVNVVWTVDNDAVVVENNNDGTVTIKVVRGEEAISYKLTATITDGDKTLTSSWDCVVPAVPATSPKDILDAAYALQPGESLADAVTLTGIVASIDSAYSEQYGNITVTIFVEDMLDKPVQCFRLTGEGAKDIAFGDNITVTGILKNYNGTIEFDAGCTLDARKTMLEIVDAGYALESGKAMDRAYTLIGVITSVDTPYSEQYGNITVTIAVPGCEDKPIQCFRLKGEGAAELTAGYMVAVYGTLKNYNGTIEFDAGCALLDYAAPESEEPEPETLTIPEANTLGAAQTGYTEELYIVSGTISQVANTTYGNIYISDAAGNSFYLYGLYDAEGNRYDAMALKPAVGDVLTVVGAVGQYNGAPQMKNAVIVEHIPALTIPAANELGAAQSGSYTEQAYMVSGIVTEIKNATYGNLYITDAEGNQLYIYGLYDAENNRYDAMALKPAVGDVLTVVGGLGNYNGAPQMKNAVVLTHLPVLTIPAANELGIAGTDTNKYLVTGVVTEIKNTTYGNMYIQDAEGNELYIYGLYDAIGDLRYDAMPVKPQVGDSVSVYGVMSQYNGAPQMKNAWLLGHTIPSEEPAPEEPTEIVATLSFADKSTRTSFSNTQQVWEQNGITFTNDKASYNNNLGDYAGPVRIYAGTSVNIAFPGMTKIEINCNSGKPVAGLTDSLTNISGITVTTSNRLVTIEFAEATDSFTIPAIAAQVRFDNLTVYAAAGSSEPEQPVETVSTLSFADKSTRTSFSNTQQVWEQDGIVFTNDKASYNNNLGDYAGPVRIYAGTSVTIQKAGMTKIEINCNSGKPVAGLT
ncbi:MAG: hypothetical protein IKK11_00025, partial [Oscillospiraceae bacterium]|nr:hypothetical protein [Oscillospiraceae bacterium]